MRMVFFFQLVKGLDGPRYMCETEVIEEVALAGSNVEYVSSGNHTSKNANGNIITLTLKNNHLIVETEERAVSIYLYILYLYIYLYIFIRFVFLLLIIKVNKYC